MCYEQLIEKKTRSAYSRLVEVHDFERSGISMYRILLSNIHYPKGGTATKQHIIICQTLSMMTR